MHYLYLLSLAVYIYIQKSHILAVHIHNTVLYEHYCS